VEVVRELLKRAEGMDNEKLVLISIHAGAESGHVEVVREMLNRGARMDIKCFGCTHIYA